MVYNYTKPRGPIAAMYSSPGPVYKLPTLLGAEGHDVTHSRAPASSFGSKLTWSENNASPGPCYLPSSKLTNKGMEPGCQFSILGRPKDMALFNNPGPQAYGTVEASKHLYGPGLAFSFGKKLDSLKTDHVPGPNVYNLDSMLGKTVRSDKASSHVHSITGRSKMGGFDEDLKKTPGPGAYTVPEPSSYKENQPKWSLLGRNHPPTDSTKKPSPDAYNPSLNDKKTAPKFTFGIKHSQYKGEYITDEDK
ncbi:Outer dense fiber protein 3 [Cichlidogyrus casuarinus]|uniref:Outer dense fiber protein 3 n=1 Tax=Cichlidogyrus casuarinus TaxID=1844966 RepID=A0ABD2QMR4_9PLAT